MYINILKKQLVNSVKNSEAYSSFSSIGSDHRIITTNICLSIISNGKQIKRTNYDWSILKNHTISNEYNMRVNHILTDLNKTSVVNTPTNPYNNFIKTNEEAAKCLLNKYIKPRDKIASQDNKIKTLRNDVKITYNAYTVPNTI